MQETTDRRLPKWIIWPGLCRKSRVSELTQCFESTILDIHTHRGFCILHRSQKTRHHSAPRQHLKNPRDENIILTLSFLKLTTLKSRMLNLRASFFWCFCILTTLTKDPWQKNISDMPFRSRQLETKASSAPAYFGLLWGHTAFKGTSLRRMSERLHERSTHTQHERNTHKHTHTLKDEEKKNSRKNKKPADCWHDKNNCRYCIIGSHILLFGCANAEHDFEMLCHVFSYQLTCLYGVFSNIGHKNSMFSISIPSMKKSSWYLELCAIWPHVHCNFYHVKGASFHAIG